MNNKGVTLIELLIVIVVLGIISAFAIPAVGDVITNTEKESVLQDARTLESAARLYCGQKTCSTDELAGLTWTELGPLVEVFDEDAYVQTDGTGGDIAVYNGTTKEWTITLDGAAVGDYSFGGADATNNPGAVPSSSDKTKVVVRTN